MRREFADESNLLSLAKGLQGGINDPTLFPKWLDDNLYEGATFTTLRYQRRPYIWINASDIYDRTPFVFGPALFGALCSDLANYPVSLAVAASAAVPVAFAPVVIQGYPGGCPVPLPHWVHRVRSNPNAPPLLRNFANAMYRYHSGEVRYVKLLDGGIVDNMGLPASPSRGLPPNSLRAPAARRGRETAAHAISSRRCWSRAVGCLVADRGRPLRRQPDYGGLRHRDRIRRCRQLLVVPRDDEQLAGGADRLALQALCG